MTHRFVIAAIPRPDDDEPLFWSNSDGWGSLTNATVFSSYERTYYSLPLGAYGWIELPKEDA